ncbi:MAG: SH3 domain-containing protein, partial [Spirochaetales bacterium]|nr:SH3 domain-containing protein [Spirochaetales bacterium]
MSCSKKVLGYGTVLWSLDESSLSTGQNITVISESELADVYLITDGSSNEPIQIDRWRVAIFEDQAQAEKNSKVVSEYSNIYARNLKDGLLIREEPDINSDRAYKMRKDQILKVYGKTSDISTIGQYEGYWYKVITEEGVTGYCFDHYLDIYDNSVSLEEKENPAVILIDTAFTKIYHPSSYIEMIKNSAIDLRYFTPQTGLFPDLENKNLKIVSNNHSINFLWDTPVLVDKRSFSLGEDGIVVHVLSDTKLQVSYYYEDQKIITTYHVIDGLEDIILTETERREGLYNSLIEAGTSFSSNAYGNIKMQIDGSFTWENYDRLVPQIIPSGSEGKGKIRFNNFISNELKEEYTSIITFNFKYGERIIPIDFLYTLDGNKLRLTYVPEKDISDENIVSKKSISPVVIAFSAN